MRGAGQLPLRRHLHMVPAWHNVHERLPKRAPEAGQAAGGAAMGEAACAAVSRALGLPLPLVLQPARQWLESPWPAVHTAREAMLLLAPIDASSLDRLRDGARL